MEKAIAGALLGAGIGAAVAHFWPDLGLSKLESASAGLGRAFGETKPYWRNAFIGAATGLLVGILLKKK